MWTCRLIDLEVVYGSRARDVADIIEERRALPMAPIDASVMDRAVQVAGGLARTGQHRGARPVGLVIAAAAEAAGLSVLHYDSDYDRIAALTNQPTEWIAPAGTSTESLRGPGCRARTCLSASFGETLVPAPDLVIGADLDRRSRRAASSP